MAMTSNFPGCALALLALLATSLARAEPPVPSASCAAASDGAEPPADYRGAVHDAIVDYEAGLFLEARVHFLRAHGLWPNARTLRGLGMVEFELRNYGESVRHLEAALACAARPLDAQLAEESRILLERARAYVGEVHVAVEPPSASISVDGVTVASGPDAALVLLVGDHVLEFQAHGARPERRAVSVKSGERTALRIALESLPPDLRVSPLTLTLPLAATPPVESERRPDRAIWRKWWLWTAVGVVAAGTATTVLLMTRTREQREPALTEHVPPGVSVSTLLEAR